MEKLVELIQTGLAEIRAIAERAEAEAKRYGETTAETKQALERLNARLDELETRLARQAVVPATPGAQAAEDPAKKAFFKYMREGRAALSDADLAVLFPQHRRALVEDGTGEILVPEQLESEIYRELPRITVIRQLATVRTLARGNRIRRRSLTEVVVGWGKLETGAALQESSPVPGEEFQYVEDLYGLAKIGEDELSDTDVALEPIITDSFARAIAEAEDDAFIAGTGHANGQPEGILRGSVVERIDAGQPGAITADDMIRLADAVPEQYRRNGVYIVRSTTKTALRLLKDNEGRYLWQPSLQAGEPDTFNGYRVYTQDAIPAIPEAGEAADVAIFGDIRSGYRVLDRQGMTIQRLVELYAEQGLVGFKVHARVGGGVIRPNALRVLRVPAA